MASAADSNLTSARLNTRNRVPGAVASGTEVGGLSLVILGIREILQNFFSQVETAQHNEHLLSL